MFSTILSFNVPVYYVMLLVAHGEVIRRSRFGSQPFLKGHVCHWGLIDLWPNDLVMKSFVDD